MPSNAALLGRNLPVQLDLEYLRFQRLGFLGFFTVLLPHLIQVYFHAGFSLVRLFLLATISLYCIHLSLSYRKVNFRRNPIIAFALICLLAARPFVEWVHRDLEISSIFSFFATSIVVWAVWSLQPKVEWLRIFGVYAAVMAVIALLMAILTPNVAYMITESGNFQGGYKGVLGLGLLAGPFSNANTLGILMASSVPVVFFWLKNSTRVLLLLPIGIALLLSFARTSIIAVIVVLILAVLIFNEKRSFGFKYVTAFVFVSVLAGIQLWIPFFTHDPELFTGRGAVWIVDVEAWLRNPWLGNGEAWYSLQDYIQAGISQVSHTNSHNTFLGWLVLGGIFYFVCCSGILVMLFYSSFQLLRIKNVSAPILYVVVILIVGISESFWHLWATSPLFFMNGLIVISIVCSRKGEAFKDSGAVR